MEGMAQRKFIVAFLIIVAVVGGGYFVWNRYVSPEARQAREQQANYEKATKALKDFEEAMKQDTYGGKTPEETLQLFITALEKEDIELASKYFMLETNTQDTDYLTRRKWEEGLQQMRIENRISETVRLVKQMQLSNRDMGSNDVRDYVVKGTDGVVDYAMTLRRNKYSGVWKIESL